MRSLYNLIAFIFMACLTGCGGGGGGGGASSTLSPNPISSPTSTIITGVASKGIIRNGTVKVYAVSSDGSKGSLLKETSTDASGSYSADIGAYTGPILVEASGSYIDEATGNSKSIPVDAPLRAAIGNATGTVTIAVTPLTELAVKKVENPTSKKLTVGGIDAANSQVSATFKVDIVKTLPVDATAAVPAGTIQSRQEYALALAAVSQMMKNKGQDLPAALTQLSSSISADNRLATQAAVEFQAALSEFAHSDSNKTDIKDITATNLIAIGGTSAILKLSTQGTLTGGISIGGIEVTMNLPTGVTVKTDTNGIFAGIISTSGVVPSGSLMQSRYIPAPATSQGSIKMAFVNTTGFGVGEFATIRCDVAAGKAVQAADFSLSGFKAVDGKGAAITDLTAALTAEIK